MPRKMAIWQTGLRLTTRFLVVIESKPHTFALVSTDVKDRQFPILFLRERERASNEAQPKDASKNSLCVDKGRRVGASDKYTTCLLFLSKNSKLREAYSFQKHYYLSLSLSA